MKRAPSWTSTVLDTGIAIHAATWKGCHLTVRGRVGSDHWKLTVERRSRAGTVISTVAKGTCVDLGLAKYRARVEAENAEAIR